MDADAVRQLMTEVQAGSCSPDDAVRALERLPYADLGFASVDHHRSLRQGLGEVVFGPQKTPEQCVGIIGELLASSSGPVVLSRATDEQAAAVLGSHPEGAHTGRTVVWRAAPPRPDLAAGAVAVVTAGTSDLAVADECATILAAHGVEATRLTDVGVAGIHRLLSRVDVVLDAQLVVVCAGMDGALASVVGGLTSAPVIAVPTSVGYGSAFEGVTALLSMLASCASGVSVVGIDNGFGAAFAALRLLESQRRIDASSVDTTEVST